MNPAEHIARTWDASPDASATPAVQAMARAEIAGRCLMREFKV